MARRLVSHEEFIQRIVFRIHLPPKLIVWNAACRLDSRLGCFQEGAQIKRGSGYFAHRYTSSWPPISSRMISLSTISPIAKIDKPPPSRDTYSLNVIFQEVSCQASSTTHPRQTRLEANETLPIKLDKIVDKLAIHDRVKGEHVAIKMHLGGNVGYSTLHPVFVRRVVKAVKDGGGKPFIVDLNWSAGDAAERGYTAETLGCSIFPPGAWTSITTTGTRTRSRTSPIGC